MAKKLDIDWPELPLAFDASFGEESCYLDRETGTVVTVTEDIRAAADHEDHAEGFDPQLLEAVRAIDGGSERYLPIPDQESREGYRDMEEFIATVRDPRLAELLEVAIAGRGAFRRFKDVLAGSRVSASAGSPGAIAGSTSASSTGSPLKGSPRPARPRRLWLLRRLSRNVQPRPTSSRSSPCSASTSARGGSQPSAKPSTVPGRDSASRSSMRSKRGT
jgi:hypothetical protein